MGLVLRHLASGGLQHEYWAWRQHRSVTDQVDSWGETGLPRCPSCYKSTDAYSEEVLDAPFNTTLDIDSTAPNVRAKKLSHAVGTLPSPVPKEDSKSVVIRSSIRGSGIQIDAIESL